VYLGTPEQAAYHPPGYIITSDGRRRTMEWFIQVAKSMSYASLEALEKMHMSSTVAFNPFPLRVMVIQRRATVYDSLSFVQQ
jgi:hypothetical protein